MNDHDHRHPTAPLAAHLVGSVPLDDAEAVFRTLSASLGPHVRRLPDGETGRRRRWVRFVHEHLAAHPGLEVDPDVAAFQFKQWDGKVVFEIDLLRIREGTDPAALTFKTGYADDAIRNFEIYDRLCADGTIPEGVKYQICMATPLAIAYNFISPSAFGAFVPVYTDHLAQELERIAATLPNDRISHQWDVCQEVLLWEGYYGQYPGFKESTLGLLGKIGDMVPTAIDLGYHLCYGSPADEHLVLPEDMSILVEIANGIAATASRSIQYVHMPVPKDRNDRAYFEPLGNLNLAEDTGLYLGLIHDGDGENNARKLAMARAFVPVAGVGAECGIGRIKNPARLTPILDEHRLLAEIG